MVSPSSSIIQRNYTEVRTYPTVGVMFRPCSFGPNMLRTIELLGREETVSNMLCLRRFCFAGTTVIYIVIAGLRRTIPISPGSGEMSSSSCEVVI